MRCVSISWVDIIGHCEVEIPCVERCLYRLLIEFLTRVVNVENKPLTLAELHVVCVAVAGMSLELCGWPGIQN